MRVNRLDERQSSRCLCSFLTDQKGTEKVATVEVGLFPASCRGALLLSSLKEVSKKGASGKLDERHLTVSSFLFGHPKRKRKKCHRFDAVDADQGAKPPGPRTAGNLLMSPHRLLPGPPCGPGVQVLPQREKDIDRANTCKEKVPVYRSCCRTFHPACKVRPGAAGGGMACRLSLAGDLGGRPPSRRPPVRKGGAFLGSSFGDERRIALRQAAGHLPTKEE